jgi:hypothetical protein
MAVGAIRQSTVLRTVSPLRRSSKQVGALETIDGFYKTGIPPEDDQLAGKIAPGIEPLVEDAPLSRRFVPVIEQRIFTGELPKTSDRKRKDAFYEGCKQKVTWVRLI